MNFVRYLRILDGSFGNSLEIFLPVRELMPLLIPKEYPINLTMVKILMLNFGKISAKTIRNYTDIQ